MSAFLVSQKTMNRVVRAIMPNAHHSDLRPLGNRLYAMNQDALRQRYGDKDDAPEFKFDPHAGVCSKMQAYKSLNCLIYQCSEGNVPENQSYKMLVEKRDDLANEIAHALPGWDEAEWD